MPFLPLVTLVKTTTDTLSLSLQEMDFGSFVFFQLPELPTAADGTK
jgi:hypothetical protein